MSNQTTSTGQKSGQQVPPLNLGQSTGANQANIQPVPQTPGAQPGGTPRTVRGTSVGRRPTFLPTPRGTQTPRGLQNTTQPPQTPSGPANTRPLPLTPFSASKATVTTIVSPPQKLLHGDEIEKRLNETLSKIQKDLNPEDSDDDDKVIEDTQSSTTRDMPILNLEPLTQKPPFPLVPQASADEILHSPSSPPPPSSVSSEIEKKSVATPVTRTATSHRNKPLPVPPVKGNLPQERSQQEPLSPRFGVPPFLPHGSSSSFSKELTDSELLTESTVQEGEKPPITITFPLRPRDPSLSSQSTTSSGSVKEPEAGKKGWGPGKTPGSFVRKINVSDLTVPPSSEVSSPRGASSTGTPRNIQPLQLPTVPPTSPRGREENLEVGKIEPETPRLGGRASKFVESMKNVGEKVAHSKVVKTFGKEWKKTIEAGREELEATREEREKYTAALVELAKEAGKGLEIVKETTGKGVEVVTQGTKKVGETFTTVVEDVRDAVPIKILAPYDSEEKERVRSEAEQAFVDLVKQMEQKYNYTLGKYDSTLREYENIKKNKKTYTVEKYEEIEKDYKDKLDRYKALEDLFFNGLEKFLLNYINEIARTATFAIPARSRKVRVLLGKLILSDPATSKLSSVRELPSVEEILKSFEGKVLSPLQQKIKKYAEELKALQLFDLSYEELEKKKEELGMKDKKIEELKKEIKTIEDTIEKFPNLQEGVNESLEAVSLKKLNEELEEITEERNYLEAKLKDKSSIEEQRTKLVEKARDSLQDLRDLFENPTLIYTHEGKELRRPLIGLTIKSFVSVFGALVAALRSPHWKDAIGTLRLDKAEIHSALIHSNCEIILQQEEVKDKEGNIFPAVEDLLKEYLSQQAFLKEVLRGNPHLKFLMVDKLKTKASIREFFNEFIEKNKKYFLVKDRGNKLQTLLTSLEASKSSSNTKLILDDLQKITLLFEDYTRSFFDNKEGLFLKKESKDFFAKIKSLAIEAHTSAMETYRGKLETYEQQGGADSKPPTAPVEFNIFFLNIINALAVLGNVNPPLATIAMSSPKQFRGASIITSLIQRLSNSYFKDNPLVGANFPETPEGQGVRQRLERAINTFASSYFNFCKEVGVPEDYVNDLEKARWEAQGKPYPTSILPVGGNTTPRDPVTRNPVNQIGLQITVPPSSGDISQIKTVSSSDVVLPNMSSDRKFVTPRRSSVKKMEQPIGKQRQLTLEGSTSTTSKSGSGSSEKKEVKTTTTPRPGKEEPRPLNPYLTGEGEEDRVVEEVFDITKKQREASTSKKIKKRLSQKKKKEPSHPRATSSTSTTIGTVTTPRSARLDQSKGKDPEKKGEKKLRRKDTTESSSSKKHNDKKADEKKPPKKDKDDKKN